MQTLNSSKSIAYILLVLTVTGDTEKSKNFNPYRPDPGRGEKINLNFIFTLLCGASKGFMKTLKAFIKPFEAPQRSVKIKI